MTDALAGLSPERAREIVETVTYWLDNPPTSGSDREHLYSSVRAMLPLAERGLATLGATEAWTDADGVQALAESIDSVAPLWSNSDGILDEPRRVLILREGA